MRYVIASDIHGSAFYTEKLLERVRQEKADKLILLGDIYNHGPRNPLPEGFAEMSVAEMLNGIKDNLLVIKGNCDSQVDTLISEFDFFEDAVIETGGKLVFLTHGHVYNKDNPPKVKFDAVIYGHFHTGFIEKINGTAFINAGSVSLPKCDTAHSYLVLDDGKVELKDIDGTIIDKITL